MRRMAEGIGSERPDHEDPGMSANTFDHARDDAERSASDSIVGSPAPPLNAPHEGQTGHAAPPLGDDPRPGNVGQSAEAPIADDLDGLDESSDESFPASDPPSWSAAPTLGEERPAPRMDPRHYGLGRVVDETDPETDAEAVRRRA